MGILNRSKENCSDLGKKIDAEAGCIGGGGRPMASRIEQICSRSMVR